MSSVDVNHGPILFLLYTADIIDLIQQHQLLPHLYVDDTQVYDFCRPDQTSSLCQQIIACVEDVAKLMSANRLQLNNTWPRQSSCGAALVT